MPNIGLTEVMSPRGTIPEELYPVAAAQTLAVGDLVYLNAGLVTLCAAAGADVNTDTLILGVMNQASVAAPVNTLVSVCPLSAGDLLVLPSFGAAPAIANLASGAPTTGFTIRNDGGVYKANLSATAKAVIRIRNFDSTDGRDATGRKLKATPVVGDRVICKLLAAALQI